MKRKLRLLDFLIVLTIFIAIFGYINLKNFTSSAQGDGKDNTKVDMVIYKDSVQDFVGSHIKKGDVVIEKMSNQRIGVVKDIQIGESVNISSNIEGKTVRASKDGYSSVTIVVETNGGLSGNGVLIDGVSYYVGKTMTFTAGISLLDNARIIGAM